MTKFSYPIRIGPSDGVTTEFTEIIDVKTCPAGSWLVCCMLCYLQGDIDAFLVTTEMETELNFWPPFFQL